MCFSTSVPKPPPPPATPTIDDDAVKNREAQEAARLRSQAGTAASIRSDLRPEEQQGKKKVLLGV